MACVSLRQIATYLQVSRKTVARPLHVLGQMCGFENLSFLTPHAVPVDTIQIDERQDFEYTKCKPIPLAIAVSTQDGKD